MFKWLFGSKSKTKELRPTSVGKILILGENCTDVFQYGTSDRICPEAPVPVFIPGRTTTNSGMAGNVVENVKSLGCTDYEFISPRTCPIKTRYVDEASNQMLLRIDENDVVPRISRDDFHTILGTHYDLVIISDYHKGYLSLSDIEEIVKVFPMVFIDSKNPRISNIIPFLGEDSYLKVNEHEYHTAFDTHFFEENPDAIERIVITMGSDGAMLDGKIYRSLKIRVRDVAGAGDTFLAALATKYAETSNIDIAITFANNMALQVVQQPGVVACVKNQISPTINLDD